MLFKRPQNHLFGVSSRIENEVKRQYLSDYPEFIRQELAVKLARDYIETKDDFFSERSVDWDSTETRLECIILSKRDFIDILKRVDAEGYANVMGGFE